MPNRLTQMIVKGRRDNRKEEGWTRKRSLVTVVCRVCMSGAIKAGLRLTLPTVFLFSYPCSHWMPERCQKKGNDYQVCVEGCRGHHVPPKAKMRTCERACISIAYTWAKTKKMDRVDSMQRKNNIKSLHEEGHGTASGEVQTQWTAQQQHQRHRR